MIEFDKDYPSISEVDIQVIESQIGASLPNDYRQFMLKNNGGSSPVDKEYLFAYKEGSLIFAFFHQIKHGNGSLEEYLSRKHSFLFPQKIPIGAIRGGYLAMSVDEADRGAMYVYYSDALPEKITNSFSEFIDNLEVVDIDEM